MSGTVQVIDIDGTWGFPIDDVGLDRLPVSDTDAGGHTDGVDLDDADTTTVE